MGRRLLFLMLVLSAPFFMAHHPPYPAVLDFLPHEESGDWTLFTTAGFVSADDDRGLACKEAFGVDGALYSAVLGPNHFAVNATDGVAVTTDGCNLEYLHPVVGRVVELDAMGDTLVVATNDFSGSDRVYASFDGGRTLEEVALLPEDLTVTFAVLLDETTAVVSAYLNTGTNRGVAHLLFVDLDTKEVETFIPEENWRFPYVFTASDGTIAWAVRGEIHPLVVWGPREEPHRYRSTLDVWPLDVRFDSDEGQLWVAGLDRNGDGAGIAVDGERVVADPRFEGHFTNCLVPDAGGLWLCSDGFEEAYELWRVDGDESLLPIYRLAYLEGTRAQCPSESDVGQICPGVWELISESIARRPLNPEDNGGSEEGDGEGDGDSELPDWFPDHHNADSEEELDQESTSSWGCQSSGGEAPWTSFLVLAAFLSILAAGSMRGGLSLPRRDLQKRGF